MRRHHLFMGVVLVSLAVAGLVSAKAQTSVWGKDYLPNVPVMSQNGERLLFYDDAIKGKIVVISFIYTSCRDICPVVTARLAQVEEKLGAAVGRDIFFVSISIDPLNDTPGKLKEYADAFQAGPGWLFLTGKPEDIDLIRYKLGDRSRKLSEHRNEIWLANDATGDWARDSVFGDIDSLAMTISAMDPSQRSQMGKTEQPGGAAGIPHSPGTVAGGMLTDLPGQALFIKTCASCHTIGQGAKVGPDLSGLTTRRAREWIVSYIMTPDKMRSQKDRAALRLAEHYPSVRMPNLGLSTNDATDLIAYMEAMSYAAAADNKSRTAHEHVHVH
ncbi:SCO family protein [Microvirga sp. BT689]|uniref:SCO family protein n=1 Tax=Microvirga arvi TaxID=2778731 RepID=UPI0019502590|nr:SCO family protein [Microvirga arvi]MBM6579380.1 SCO family protein [Microvirga arvi]